MGTNINLISKLKTWALKKKNPKDDKSDGPKTVILARLPSRFLPDGAADSTDLSITAQNDLFGLIHFTIHEATLFNIQKSRDYYCTVSIGKQALTSDSVHVGSSSDLDGSSLPSWDVSSEFVLKKGGASIAKVSVFKQSVRGDRFEAYCEIDLASYFKETIVSESDGKPIKASSENLIQDGTFDLLDPLNPEKVVGHIHLSGKAASIAALEKQVWDALFALADWNDDGSLTEDEFGVLLQALGTTIDREQVHDLFSRADKDNSGAVDAQELAAFLAVDSTSFSELVRRCPVDGAELSSDPSKSASNLIYVWMALSATMLEADGSMKAGAKGHEAASAWMLRLSDWASHPFDFPKPVGFKSQVALKAGGLRVGHAAAHILIYNREEKRIEEEKISPVLSLAIRTMYQSKVGRALLRQSKVMQKLVTLSEKEGKYRDSEESAKDIVPFVESFRGQIDIAECEKSIEEFTTFNDFFYRKLRPGARPIAEAENPNVIVSAADCRLQVFQNVDEATRFWIKGRNFSIAGLLGDVSSDRALAKKFTNGTMAIFRLAPQDYHRFHSPVDGTILSFNDLPGNLLTVNPIAVNSIYCDVFSVNKRSVCIIKTPTMGEIAFIAVGATLVGSINWTVKENAQVKKGDELGYFAFGGSTCIALFPDGFDVCWDGDLITNSHKSLESLVKVGERIGCKKGTDADDSGDPDREELIKRTETLTSIADVKPLNERPELQRFLSGEIEGFSSPCEEDVL